MGRGERPRSASGLLVIEAPFVADPSLGVNIRTRLKGLTAADEDVLRQVGTLLGGLASKDLAERVRCGTDHDSDDWARRKRDLTAPSTSRWAGAITKASNQQWALSRRCQAAHIATLRRGIDTLDRRLEQEIGAKGSKGEPGGYRSRGEWFQKSRRREALRNKLAAAKADRAAGHVTVVRGGRKLANTRHNLEAAGITEAQWRHRWELARWFISADGETGKPGGNETIRLTGDGQLSLRLPDALIHLANAPWGRYVLSGRVQFSHRGQEWEAQVGANRAVAYTITLNPETGRWYLDAAWTRNRQPAAPLETLRAGRTVGVDMNADHIAAWLLDRHGNPVGSPKTFRYDLSGTAEHRDAQLRHALSGLIHWAQGRKVAAFAIEDLDFSDSTTREKHGGKKWFRQLVSGIPTAKLRSRILAMATEAGIAVIAVDPAYTTKWGAAHWKQPLKATHPQTTGHHAASVAIGRRALGHRLRRRVTPPPPHQSDVVGHRITQAETGDQERETTCQPEGPQTRSVGTDRGAERRTSGDPRPFGDTH